MEGVPATAGEARTLDDAGLAARIGSGRDREAEAELCRRFAPRIRLYGLRHLRQEAAAQDLVQEVLVLVLARLRDGSVRDPARLASFVLGTCRLAVTGQRRSTARRGALLATFGDALAAADAAAPRLDLDRLDACLEALPARDRAVMVLTFYASADSAAIATQLATTSGNVRVVRHRALERLRACVAAGEDGRS